MSQPVMNPILDEIVHASDLRSTHRLRLLLEAGRVELGVDVISCFVEGDCIPFSRAIQKAAPTAQAALEFWPFYFAGGIDPVPLYAMLEPAAASRLVTLPDGPGTPKALYNNKHEYTGAFSDRERIAHYYKLTARLRGRPRLILIFNYRHRSNHPDLWDRDGPAPAWSVDHLEAFASLAVQLVVDSEAEQIDRYERIANQFLDRAHEYTTKLASFSNPSLWLRQFFAWLTYAIATIPSDPTMVASCYCVAQPTDEGNLFASRPLSHKDTEVSPLQLVPVADNGAAFHRSDTCIRTYSYAAMNNAIWDSFRIRRTDAAGTSQHNWYTEPPGDDYRKANPEPDKRCGLITVATHTASPLYLLNIKRRFNRAVPIYGLAYSEFDKSCRSAYAVPLLKDVVAGNSSIERRAIGAIAFESPRRCAITPRDASFIACLLNCVIAYFPQELFDSNRITIPSYRTADRNL